MKIAFDDTQTRKIQLYAVWAQRDIDDPAVLGSLLVELVDAELESLRTMQARNQPIAGPGNLEAKS
jgi:hypothetical protein